MSTIKSSAESEPIHEILAGKLALYDELRKGLEDAEAGRIRPVAEALADLKTWREKTPQND